MPTLTPTAAKDLGRSLRFVRLARNETLRDLSIKAAVSPQYLQQVERAIRLNVSEEVYAKVARALDIPEPVIADLILKARVQSALEQRGLEVEQIGFVWRGIEQRLSEVGVNLETDLSRVVVDILR